MSSDHPQGAPQTAHRILHDQKAQQFRTVVEGHTCVLDYTLTGAVADFYHTGVPAPVGGRGIAAELVQFGMETARARGWKVVPTCSYAAAWLERHPEYRDLTV